MKTLSKLLLVTAAAVTTAAIAAYPEKTINYITHGLSHVRWPSTHDLSAISLR